MQLSRIRLLPRVCNGEAQGGPRVEDTGSWGPLINQPVYSIPVLPTGLPFDQEFTPAVATDEGEAQEVEGLRLAEPRCLRFFAAKRPNSMSRVFSG